MSGRLHARPRPARSFRTAPLPAATIGTPDRALALRAAALLRSHGGRPCPREAGRYEFPSAEARARAMESVRSLWDWTAVEPAD